MNKERIQVLLSSPELDWVTAEAKKKSISKSAVIRQIVEMSRSFNEGTIKISYPEMLEAITLHKDSGK